MFLRIDFKRLLSVFVFFTLLVSTGHAWKKKQNVIGVIRDQDGRAIYGVNVHFKGLDLGKDYRASTDRNGNYAMPSDLLTDSRKQYTYEVRLMAQHYQSVFRKIQVPFVKNQAVKFDFRMQRDFQNQKVQGYVKDADTRTPIVGASVSLKGPKGMRKYSVTTNAQGWFQFAQGVTTDPDANSPFVYQVSVEAKDYLPHSGSEKIFKSANHLSFEYRLKRGLKGQHVKGKVVDAVSKKGIAGVAIVFNQQGQLEKVTAKSDAQGNFELGKKLITDPNPEKAYTYVVKASIDNYFPLEKSVKVLFLKNRSFQVDLALGKQKLKAPQILSPQEKSLTLRPVVKIGLDGGIAIKKINIEIAPDKTFKKVAFKKSFDNPEIKSKSFTYNLSKEESLLDDQKYFVRASYVTEDDFESNWALHDFLIPSSESLNPPLPEHVVTRDEDYVSIYPAWAYINGKDVLLFASNRGEEEDLFEIWSTRPGAAGFTKVTTAVRNSMDTFPVFGPGKKHISFVSNRVGSIYNIWSVPVSGAKLLIQRSNYTKGQVTYPTISRDGSLIAFARLVRFKKGATRIRTSIWTMSDNGSNLTQLCRGTMPRISPSGKYILYVADLSGNREVWRINTDGTGNTQLTSSAEDKGHPDWVDDNKIVYESSKAGNSDIWMLDLKTGINRQLTNNLADEVMPACSYDGTKIAYVSDRGRQKNIYYVDLTPMLESQESSRLGK